MKALPGLQGGVTAAIRTRSNEGGMALVMALLVLLILMAVISQLVISTALDDASARNEALRTQMIYAADTALLEAAERIKDDFQEGGDGGAAGGLGGAAGGLGSMMGQLSGDAGTLGAGLGGGAAGAVGQDPGGTGEESEEEAAVTDSMEDTWADVLETDVGRVHLTVHVEDEQRRFNLLSCLSDDEEWAERSREILIRVLDIYREGTVYDLSFSDAEEIADRMIEWMQGGTRNEDLPRPALQSDLAEDDRSLPWGLREFLLVEGIDPFMFYDTWSEEGLPVPGLESVLTVWTSLADGSAQAEADEEAASDTGAALGPLGGGTQTTSQMAGASSNASGASSQSLGEPPVPAALGGGGSGLVSRGALVNLNTAMPAVLKSLVATSDLSGEVVDAILEWRLELVEGDEAEAKRQDALDDDDPFNDDDQGPRNVFGSVDDLGLVQAFADYSDNASKQLLAELLDVQSDVFTIYVTARVIPPGSDEAQRLSAGEALEEPWKEPPGLALHIQSVVWRTSGGEGPQLIPLIPWEERVAPKINHGWWARNEEDLWR